MEIKKINEYEGIYKTSGEYAAALRSWLSQVHHLQCISAGFPYFLAASLQQASGPAISSTASITSSSTTTTTTSRPTTTTPAPQSRQQQLPTERGREYTVPPLWKRFIAETIDFLLLFTIKLAVTYVAVDFFDVFDIDQFNLETLRADVLSDYRLTMNMTWDILLLETIHRIGNCLFEALCLHRGGGGVGGATPGKRVMGLRVVRCQWAVPTLNDQVLVYPAQDLGLGRALLRAVAKNIAITLLFPLCVTMFFYQHNRTLYDVLAGSVVVEERRPVVNRNNNDNNNNNRRQ
uniref:Protein FAM8A1-like n=1 Tax=Hirondellea gigas TaxID=1518452 RepID=A0A2P2I3T7_9CRUS